jgi:hypothetical protein
MSTLLALLLGAADESAAQLRERITEVSHAGLDDEMTLQKIAFKLDGVAYVGVLRGRNADLCMGFGSENDRGIAARVLIDGDATP